MLRIINLKALCTCDRKLLTDYSEFYILVSLICYWIDFTLNNKYWIKYEDYCGAEIWNLFACFVFINITWWRKKNCTWNASNCLSGAAVRSVFLTVPPTSQIRSDVWVVTKISIARNICIFYHNSDKTWVTAW